MSEPTPNPGWTCPRCHGIAAAGSRFCPSCGQPFAAAPPPAQANRNLWPWVMGLLGLIGLTAAGLFASGILKAPGKVQDPVLIAPGEPPTPQLRAKVEKPVEVKMPDDLYQWLKHLEETERRRGLLAKDQTGRARALMTKLSVSGAKMQLDAMLGEATGETEGSDKPPEQGEFVDQVGPMKQGWADLDTFFKSYPPPAECVPIAENYQKTLENTGSMIVRLVEIVQNAPTDPSQITNLVAELETMRGDSEQNVGQPAADADQGVIDLCAKYNTRKWFTVHRDFGGSSGLLGAGGVGF